MRTLRVQLKMAFTKAQVVDLPVISTKDKDGESGYSSLYVDQQ